ncbi:HYD1 signature containing ADP-ribosyltransferase family protein [Streptosporangium sp. NPDC020072]|uniref:HYD1 signature containing ADP-ribosyltransferase family protein n=1 Tax=Streptosporangium sp. NPDC020072 TaxID=3154788 RepID=UPI003434049F
MTEGQETQGSRLTLPGHALKPPGRYAAETMWHYTSATNLAGILKSRRLNPSLARPDTNDARYGDGQYVSDIPPGSRSASQLSLCFLRVPYAVRRFTHYVEVDVTGLEVVYGREHVFVIPSREPLDLTSRIVSWGSNDGLVSQGALASRLPRGTG